MLAENLISPYLPFAVPTDRIADVVTKMVHFNLQHITVVDNQLCLGVVARMHLEQLPADDVLSIHLAELPHIKASVQTHQHFFDVIEQINTYSLTCLPVVNELEQYVGAVALPDVVRSLNHLTAAEEPGFVVVLQMMRQDYSLTELAGIVESSNSRILSLYLSPVPESRELFVNLKITGESSAPIVLSFQRYGYQVAYVFTSTQEISDTQSRYDALMRYLNI